MARQASPRERAQIEKFEAQLMAVLSNTLLSEVLGLFGLRRFTPKQRVWDLVQGDHLAEVPDRLPDEPPTILTKPSDIEVGRPTEREIVRPAAA
jgi:hypothetical protein